LPLLLFACINENSLHPNFPSHNLHANSAKVWILSKSSNFDEYVVPAMRDYRKTFTFFPNLSFREQELIHLGTSEGVFGKYKIERDQQGDFVLILIYENGERAFYKVVRIKNDYLKLEDLVGEHTVWELNTLNRPAL
jgi:hypothetical protein